MFQSYTNPSERDHGAMRLDRLRQAMKRAEVSVFLVPHADEHQNEYLPERAERLAWLTGFTGSAGFAIVTMGECLVLVDGRYTLQVQNEVDQAAFTPQNLMDLPPSKWLSENLCEQDRVGFDPWLMTKNQIDAYRRKSPASFIPTGNLIDRIWTGQPQAPLGGVAIQPETYAGKSAAKKIEEIKKEIACEGADVALLTDPASLAWLFNIRGSDVIHNPVALGYAIISVSERPVLFIDPRKLDEAVTARLLEVTDIADPKNLLKHLATGMKNRQVHCDPDRVPIVLTDAIEEAGGTLVRKRDPVILPRAIKNGAEINGARNAQLRDGVAMCKFLFWLDQQVPEALTETGAARQLENIRRSNASAMGSELMEISFDTISGHGPNGAIVHYRVNEESNRQFTSNSLYLCDSGGQYPDGTTDITRTIAIGEPPASAIRDFTLVLKGHIAIATACFPTGTRGMDLDPFARRALWNDGKDFAHGTGHGVGAYLNVHEGPQSISGRGTESLKPGMIISNEPGYYVEGEYGIRIENLILVGEPRDMEGGNVPVHRFETITYCPIDLRLVDPSLLSDEERTWLNAYHASVFEKLESHLGEAERAWLARATTAI